LQLSRSKGPTHMSALSPAVARIGPSEIVGHRANRSRLSAAVYRAKSNLLGVIGLAIVVTLVVVAIAANWISPFDPNAQIGTRLTQPDGRYVLGLDQYGRDVLSRLIFGARTSLVISAASVGIALVIGGIIGLLAGFYRGWLDTVCMRLMDVLFTLPSIILAIALAGLLGATLQNVIIAIAVVTTPGLARVTRAPTLVVRQMEFVVGARAAGAG